MSHSKILKGQDIFFMVPFFRNRNTLKKSLRSRHSIWLLNLLLSITPLLTSFIYKVNYCVDIEWAILSRKHNDNNYFVLGVVSCWPYAPPWGICSFPNREWKNSLESTEPLIRVAHQENLTLEKMFNWICFPRLALDSSLRPTKPQHFPSDLRSSNANCVP